MFYNKGKFFIVMVKGSSMIVIRSGIKMILIAQSYSREVLSTMNYKQSTYKQIKFATIKKTYTFVGYPKMITLKSIMPDQNTSDLLFDQMNSFGHQKIVFCSDLIPGLKQ